MAHFPTNWFRDVITQTWSSGHDVNVSCTQGTVGQGRGPKMEIESEQASHQENFSNHQTWTILGSLKIDT